MTRVCLDLVAVSLSSLFTSPLAPLQEWDDAEGAGPVIVGNHSNDNQEVVQDSALLFSLFLSFLFSVSEENCSHVRNERKENMVSFIEMWTQYECDNTRAATLCVTLFHSFLS